MIINNCINMKISKIKKNIINSLMKFSNLTIFLTQTKSFYKNVFIERFQINFLIKTILF